MIDLDVFRQHDNLYKNLESGTRLCIVLMYSEKLMAINLVINK